VLFEQDSFGSISKLRKRLSSGYQFAPQLGILKPKPNSPDYRPLVVAPLEDRIIQRAILDILTAHVTAVKKILRTPTSIGGLPGRGVESAIKLITESIDGGSRYFLRSDIANFFMRIPKDKVKAFAADCIKDQEFLSLFERALNTELQNLEELGKHGALFPIGNDGVAQGSALSTLAGNIVLQDFDKTLNGRNIRCVRYIDDFIILGADESSVKKTFDSAQRLLGALNMVAYAPWDHHAKAECGSVSAGFTFLGCHINPNAKMIQPAKKNRLRLLDEIARFLDEALRALQVIITDDHAPAIRQRYVQTLAKLDGIISGWGHAFQFCNCGPTFDSLDHEIDKLIQRFRSRVANLLRSTSPRVFRRVLGVQLLRDIPAHTTWPSR
jgi:hypothetical protein